MRIRSIWLLGILLCLGTARPAAATLIEYLVLADYLAAVADTQTITFTELEFGTPPQPVGAQLQATLGVTFPDGDDATVAGPGVFGDGTGLDATTSVELVFSQPLEAFGVIFPGGAQIELFHDETPVGSSSSFGGEGVGFFAGVISTELFNRVVVRDPTDDHHFADDFYFTTFVPEPSSALLLLGALAGLSGLRRRA